jgi:hypothetical protein
MKTTTALLIVALAAITAPAQETTVTLPVAVTVTETTTTQTDTTSPIIESIIIDLEAREVGVKLKGVEARVVVIGEAYQAVMAPNLSALVTAVQAALTAALTPPEE